MPWRALLWKQLRVLVEASLHAFAIHHCAMPSSRIWQPSSERHAFGVAGDFDRWRGFN